MARPSPLHAGNPALVRVGQAIRALRTEVGLSQETLAYETGIDRSYLGGVERGEHNLALINLVRISKGLNVEVWELLQRAGV